MSKTSSFLFPYNGQYFTFDKFILQLDKLISSAKAYDSNVAKPISDKDKKEIIKEISKRLLKDDNE